LDNMRARQKGNLVKSREETDFSSSFAFRLRVDVSCISDLFWLSTEKTVGQRLIKCRYDPFSQPNANLVSTYD